MIIRVPHRRKYTITANQTVRDRRLTFKATGLLVYLLSLPDDSLVGYRGLMLAKKDGERSILAALRELETAGYLTRERARGQRGRFVNQLTVREIPEGDRADKTSAGKGLHRADVYAHGERRRLEVPTTTQRTGKCVRCGDETATVANTGEWLCPACEDT